MKVPLLILGALICVGYFVTRQQVRLNVQNAIENHSAVIGMTEAEARQSLGEPLSTRRTEKLFGSEAAMTAMGRTRIMVDLLVMWGDCADACE